MMHGQTQINVCVYVYMHSCMHYICMYIVMYVERMGKKYAYKILVGKCVEKKHFQDLGV